MLGRSARMCVVDVADDVVVVIGGDCILCINRSIGGGEGNGDVTDVANDMV